MAIPGKKKQNNRRQSNMQEEETFRSRSAGQKRKPRKGRIAGRHGKVDLKGELLRGGVVNKFGPAAIFRDVDYVLLALIFLISMFGIAMVFSAGSYSTVDMTLGVFRYFVKQAIWVGIGIVAMAFSTNFDYHRYYKFGNILMILSIVLLAAVLSPLGVTINGATRWLNLGLFMCTPSEYSKLFMIIFTSTFLAANPNAMREVKCLALLFGVMGAHFVLIVKQPNLSTAIVICAIIFGIMLTAGIHWIFIGGGVGLGVLGGFVILTFLKNTHWYERLTNWMDPFADFQGEGYQVSQSLIALGNGGLKGLGFGNSISKNLYLPEPQNDFIMAIIGEELGYIGFLVLMAVYMFMLYRIIRIALRSRDSLGFYLASGVAVMLGLQVIINVAVVTASMPATGITLPFVSYGGTSIVAFMYAMGIALNVSRSSNAELKSRRVK